VENGSGLRNLSAGIRTIYSWKRRGTYLGYESAEIIGHGLFVHFSIPKTLESEDEGIIRTAYDWRSGFFFFFFQSARICSWVSAKGVVTALMRWVSGTLRGSFAGRCATWPAEWVELRTRVAHGYHELGQHALAGIGTGATWTKPSCRSMPKPWR